MSFFSFFFKYNFLNVIFEKKERILDDLVELLRSLLMAAGGRRGGMN